MRIPKKKTTGENNLVCKFVVNDSLSMTQVRYMGCFSSEGAPNGNIKQNSENVVSRVPRSLSPFLKKCLCKLILIDLKIQVAEKFRKRNFIPRIYELFGWFYENALAYLASHF